MSQTAESMASFRPSVSGRRLSRRHGIQVVLAALLLSLFIHLLSYIQLGYLAQDVRTGLVTSTQQPIKIQVNPKVEPPEVTNGRIIETPQIETAPPKTATHLGAQDHVAEKETRVVIKRPQDKSLDPGAKGSPDGATKLSETDVKNQPTSPDKTIVATPAETGTVKVEEIPTVPGQTAYEKLLPSSTEMRGQVNAGFQEFIDDEIQAGDVVDLNTSEYRFIGYFTQIRKAIDLVWNYPSEAARRGMEGTVQLLMVIEKNGKVSQIKIIRSSGYPILDRAIVDAIRVASFGPLPPGIGKDKLPVVGNFTYVIGGFAGGH